MKKFILKWIDFLVVLPITLFLFLFHAKFIHALDETALTVSVENLSLLIFNILKFFVVTSAAYFIYNLFFHDFFKKDWHLGVGKNTAAVIHLILWISTLVFASIVLLSGL